MPSDDFLHGDCRVIADAEHEVSSWSRKSHKRTVDALHDFPIAGFPWTGDLKGFGLKITSGGPARYVVQYRLRRPRRSLVIARTPHEAVACCSKFDDERVSSCSRDTREHDITAGAGLLAQKSIPMLDLAGAHL